ncbi:alpha/beta hydrolase [Reyranella sp.]|jgi:pimeloyl-ACP methyl ester carboxylesterase|uniref:alpha/beta fold hydrolase n=1 Tax=Reyranella sp. TaxID=1929291 RepID=UPI002636F17C|nr:alpha/beta hydrolase [Reyranella sp.]HQT11746.1 alpha/beta hydrolase [Reyranella sp.]
MADGVEIAADAWGRRDDQPALLLHGGGQTRHAWKGTAAVLAGHGYYAVAADLRGHGESAWSPDGRYPIERFAEDVRTLAAGFTRKPVLIGASLGGIASLVAAGEAAQPIARALVLVDVTPRVDPAGVDRIRGFMAARIDDGFATLEEAADAIAQYLPHRPRPKRLDGPRKNLRLGDDGRFRWHWDPAFVRDVSRRTDGDREVRMTWAAQRLNAPLLLVRGGSSELVSEEIAREFVAKVPNARYVDVHGASHMVAGDVNDPFTDQVVAFLDSLPQPGA